MTGRSAVALFGLALVVGGAVVGFLPRSAQGVPCGSAFLYNGQAFVADLVGETAGAAAECAGARAATRLPALILLPVGGALLLVGAIRPASPAGPQPEG